MSNDKLAERQRFEEWYVTHATHYFRDPIGSRDCALQWESWYAALQAHAAEAAQPKPDDFDPRDSFTVRTDTTALQRNAGEAAQALPQMTDAEHAEILAKYGTAQSGEWAVVPIEPTREMQTAGKHALKGSADSPEWQQAVIVYQAMLAAAPQQAADPVAWLIEYDCNPATAIATTSIAVVDGLRGNRNRITPLYTHPQSAQDAKDAARYRFAQTHDGFAVCRWDEAAGPERDGEYIPIDDEDVDAAMAKESGQ